MKKRMKVLILALLAVLMVFGSSNLVSGRNRHGYSNIRWNNGYFQAGSAWTLGDSRTPNHWSVNTSFTHLTRLVQITEMRNNATGALISGSSTNQNIANIRSLSTGGTPMPPNRIIFATHEGRATTAVVRFTSIWRNQ